jgi:pyruvate ferredoxin oxidoreductase gamma subunit
MLTVRIHGRGGQGVVMAAELLSMAAFRDGKQALAFPSLGSERMGAPLSVMRQSSRDELRLLQRLRSLRRGMSLWRGST